MKRIAALTATVALVGAAILVFGNGSGASQPGDVAYPTTALVNRFGAISVQGVTDCSATYAYIVENGIEGYFDPQTDEWVSEIVPVDPDADYVSILVNADNWVATQIQSKNGKKVTIRAQHDSSRMTPCFSNDPTSAARDRCDTSGGPCVWKTEPYGWDEGTYWVVPPIGGFKRGMVHVSGAQSEVYVVQLVDKTTGATRWYTTLDMYKSYGHMVPVTMVR